MNECVLVVDDDREIVRAIALLLEKEGYTVLRAYDGMQALDMTMDRQVQLLILDVMMPKLDGLSAVLRLREKRNIPIIVLSAKSEESDKILLWSALPAATPAARMAAAAWDWRLPRASPKPAAARFASKGMATCLPPPSPSRCSETFPPRRPRPVTQKRTGKTTPIQPTNPKNSLIAKGRPAF